MMQLKSYQMNKWETLEIYKYVKGKKNMQFASNFKKLPGNQDLMSVWSSISSKWVLIAVLYFWA